MNGIMQSTNMGLLVMAAGASALFQGYLIGPANDYILQIIYQYIKKGTTHDHEYLEMIGGLLTLQQLKV